MRKKFTILTAALALLAMLAVPKGGWGQNLVNNDGEMMTRGSFEITVSNFDKLSNQSGYAGYNGTHNIDGVSIVSNQVMIQSSMIQFQKSNGYLYNSSAMPGNITKITLTGGSSSSLTIYVGTTANSETQSVTSGSTISGYYNYFKIKCGSSATGTVTGITVEYSSGGSITFSNYNYTVEYDDTYEEIGFTYANIASPSFAIAYYESDGTTPATYDWMDGTGIYQSSGYKVYCIFAQNTSTTSRTAYFKVHSGDVYSDLVTVTQSAAPAPTITLSPDAKTVPCEGETANFSIGYSNLSISEASDFIVGFYEESTGTATLEQPSWIESATVSGSDGSYSLAVVVNSNSDGERYAYFEVLALDDEDYVHSNRVTLTQEAFTVAAPTFDPNGATFHGTQNVTLSSTTTGASIRYTLDGTDPTATTGNLYTVGTPIQLTSTTTVKAIAYVEVSGTPVTSSVSSATFTQEQVATPTFSPAAGAVASGTTVSILCSTENSTIQYSTDGTTYSPYSTPIEITAETTLYAKATATGYAESEVASAHYTIRGNAVFVNGVYLESLGTQASFDNMEVVNVTGENQTWYYDSPYECADINGYDNGYVENVDWLITPRMAVENGKLSISFDVWHYYQDNQLSLKWSTSNDVGGTWHDLEFEEGARNQWNTINGIEIVSEDPYVYVAFVYDNTNASGAAEYSLRNFTARQCNTLTVSNLVGVNTFVFAGSESETLFEGEGSALVGVGLNVMVSVEVEEGYDTQSLSLLVNGVEHVGDIAGGMYQFTMPNDDVTVTASATRLPYHTVTFTTNGVETLTKEVIEDQSIETQPDANEDYIPEGYEFLGWYAGDYQDETTAPDYIDFPYTPTGDVTLKAVFAEMVTLAEPDTWTKISELSEVTAGVYALIDADGCAFNGNITSGHGQSTSQTFSFTNNVATSAPDGTCELTLVASGSGFTMYNSVKGYLYASKAASGGLAWHEEEEDYWYYGEVSNQYNWVYNKLYGSNRAALRVYNHTFRTYSSNTNDPLYMAKKTPGTPAVYEDYRTSLTETYTLPIAQHGGNGEGGWYLIASPVASVTPTADNGFITTVQDDYDLYRFDQNAELEWENYKATSSSLHPDFIALVNGRGYLYANGEAEGTTLTFEGAPYNGNGEVQLYNVEGAELAGWNLIGNPFGTPATIGTKPYYRMNYTYDNGVIVGGGNELEAATGIIAPMEGIFVHVSQDSTLTFNHATTSAPAVGMVAINILQEAQRGASQTIDRAIVRFGENGTLPKFQLNPNHTKVYIPQDGKDYAVVGADNEGEMPVNFRATKNGTYTLTINPEGVEMNYLHLIDNMTGNDVDLLATPSYTFNATTRDYESRFRLVFAANNENGVSAGSTTFAYFNNGSLVVNNEGNATLQVVDVMGRIVKSESINGSASINVNAAPGVYTLRLVNGNDVKTQKVVVR